MDDFNYKYIGLKYTELKYTGLAAARDWVKIPILADSHWDCERLTLILAQK